MARHTNRGVPKIGRVLLLLCCVAVVTSVITIAVHKGPGDAKSQLASGTGTTTTVVGANVDAKATSTTAAGTKAAVAGGKATTTTTVLVAKTPVKEDPTTTTTTTPTYVLFNVGGTGDDLIGPFVISTPATQWNVAWTYNCSNLGKKEKFNYTVAFEHGSAPDLSDVGPRQSGVKGAGVKHYYDAGAFNLSVATECSWTIKVTEIVP